MMNGGSIERLAGVGAGFFYPYRARERLKRRGPAGPLVVSAATHGSCAAHQGTAMAMWALGALTVQIVQGSPCRAR